MLAWGPTLSRGEQTICRISRVRLEARATGFCRLPPGGHGANPWRSGTYITMGRKNTRIPADYWREQPRWYRNYHTDWGGVVGDRVRRLRRARGLVLRDFEEKIERPDGGHYSLSYFSRLERGSSSAPLYVYIALAEFFGLPPGRLLGVDDAERDATAEEMVLIRFLRRAGVTPDEALDRLVDCNAGSAEPLRGGELEPDRASDFDPDAAPSRPSRQEIVKGSAELKRLDFGL